MSSYLNSGSISRYRFVTFLMFVLGLFIAIPNLLPQDELPESLNPRLQKAMNAYRSADFDGSIRMLSGLADDSSLKKDERKEVYRLLGLSYTAKGLYEKAKSAIAELLKLEPPLVELDPDREPPKLMKIYYEVRKDYTGSYAVERPDPGMKTVAVLDFMNRSIDDKEKYDPLEKGFSDLMIHQLQGATNLKVVERERIQWILDEIKLENKPGLFDAESAVRVGKQLGVHTVILGSFIKFKNDIWLGARLVKVETSEILLTTEVKGKADNFFDLSEDLAQKIADKINVRLSVETGEEVSETRSLEAMMSYSEGLSLLEQGEYKGAYQKFQEALKYDPEYTRAKYKAESIKPFIS